MPGKTPFQKFPSIPRTKSPTPNMTRDAFIFLTPKSDAEKEEFAQCGPCRMFVPEHYLDGIKGSRCVSDGSDVEVDDDDSCGFFVSWPTEDGSSVEHVVEDHAAELIKGIPGSVTPEDSGLVSRRVQCRRCTFEQGGARKCGLYEELNSKLPDTFDLNTKITPNSCCNAQEPKDGVKGEGKDGD